MNIISLESNDGPPAVIAANKIHSLFSASTWVVRSCLLWWKNLATMRMMEMMVTMLMMMETVEQSSRQISVARATRLMSNIASRVASPYSRNLKVIFMIKTVFSSDRSYLSLHAIVSGTPTYCLFTQPNDTVTLDIALPTCEDWCIAHQFHISDPQLSLSITLLYQEYRKSFSVRGALWMRMKVSYNKKNFTWFCDPATSFEKYLFPRSHKTWVLPVHFWNISEILALCASPYLIMIIRTIKAYAIANLG